MANYQYARDGYTLTRLVEGEEKVKVVYGEIVESELPENYFVTNGFDLVGDDTVTKKEKKEKPAEIEVSSEEDGEEAITVEVEEKPKKKAKK